MKLLSISLLLLLTTAGNCQVKPKTKEYGRNVYGKGGVIAVFYKDSIVVYDTMQVIKRLWDAVNWKDKQLSELYKIINTTPEAKMKLN